MNLNHKIVETLNAWVCQYLSRNETAERFKDGKAEEVDLTYSEGGDFSFVPALNFITKGYLSYQVDGVEKAAESLVLEIDPDAGLRLGDLETGWGAAHVMVMAPSQPYPRAEFKAEAVLPDALYHFRLIASVEVGSVSSESIVLGLKVIREGLVHSD